MIKEKTIIPLTYDFMFKALFGNKKNIKILTQFLSDYFNMDYKYLEGKIKILNSELIKNNKKDKKKSVDVIIELNKNEIINLEMNANRNYPGLIERNTAYICKIYSEQFMTDDEYNKTKKCIQINFNNFSVTKRKMEKVIYKLYDTKDKNVLTENLEIHHIDIDYINKICYNETIKEKLNVWVKILKATNLEEIEKRSYYMGEIGKNLVDEVERLSNDEHIIGLYDGELHERKVRASILSFERQKAKEEGFNEGIDEGIKHGIEQGIEQGIKQGMEKGIEQGMTKGISQEKEEIAKNMISYNLEIDLISNITGLPVKNIKELAKCQNLTKGKK